VVDILFDSIFYQHFKHAPCFVSQFRKKMDKKFEMDNMHSALEQHLPAEVAKEVFRVLYGNPCK
jgi:hypothetical protein